MTEIVQEHTASSRLVQTFPVASYIRFVPTSSYLNIVENASQKIPFLTIFTNCTRPKPLTKNLISRVSTTSSAKVPDSQEALRSLEGSMKAFLNSTYGIRRYCGAFELETRSWTNQEIFPFVSNAHYCAKAALLEHYLLRLYLVADCGEDRNEPTGCSRAEGRKLGMSDKVGRACGKSSTYRCLLDDTNCHQERSMIEPGMIGSLCHFSARSVILFKIRSACHASKEHNNRFPIL